MISVDSGWFQVDFSWFRVISVDSGWFQFDSMFRVWFHRGEIWNHTAVWFHRRKIWNHTAVWFHRREIWNHTAVWFHRWEIWNHTALQASTLYKLFESKVVLNVRGTWYFLRGTWYFAQNRMLVVMAGSGEAQKPYFWYPSFRPCEAGFVSILQTLRSISS